MKVVSWKTDPLALPRRCHSRSSYLLIPWTSAACNRHPAKCAIYAPATNWVHNNRALALSIEKAIL